MHEVHPAEERFVLREHRKEGDEPHIFFLRHQKENVPFTVQKKKCLVQMQGANRCWRFAENHQPLPGNGCIDAAAAPRVPLRYALMRWTNRVRTPGGESKGEGRSPPLCVVLRGGAGGGNRNPPPAVSFGPGAARSFWQDQKECGAHRSTA